MAARSVPTAAITATPKRQAQQHDAEAAHAAAQFPPGQADARGSVSEPHAGTDCHRPVRPPMCTQRSQRAASSGVVGDQQQRGAVCGAQLEQQVHHRLAGGLVQVAGRLVGQQQQRLGREGTCQRDALLLAAGELAGQVGQPVPQPDRAQRRRAPGPRRRARPASSSGTATFSSAVMVGIR